MASELSVLPVLPVLPALWVVRPRCCSWRVPQTPWRRVAMLEALVAGPGSTARLWLRDKDSPC